MDFCSSAYYSLLVILSALCAITTFGFYTSMEPYGLSVKNWTYRLQLILAQDCIFPSVFISTAVMVVNNINLEKEVHKRLRLMLNYTVWLLTCSIIMSQSIFGPKIFLLFINWNSSLGYINNNLTNKITCVINLWTGIPSLLKFGGHEPGFMYYGIYLTLFGVMIESEKWGENLLKNLSIILLWAFGYTGLSGDQIEGNLWNIFILIIISSESCIKGLENPKPVLFNFLMKNIMGSTCLKKKVRWCDWYGRACVKTNTYIIPNSLVAPAWAEVKNEYLGFSKTFNAVEVKGKSLSIFDTGSVLILNVIDMASNDSYFTDVTELQAKRLNYIIETRKPILSSFKDYGFLIIGHSSKFDLKSLIECELYSGKVIAVAEWALEIVSTNREQRSKCYPKLLLHSYKFFGFVCSQVVNIILKNTCLPSVLRTAMGSSRFKLYIYEFIKILESERLYLKTPCLLKDKTMANRDKKPTANLIWLSEQKINSNFKNGSIFSCTVVNTMLGQKEFEDKLLFKFKHGAESQDKEFVQESSEPKECVEKRGKIEERAEVEKKEKVLDRNKGSAGESSEGGYNKIILKEIPTPILYKKRINISLVEDKQLVDSGTIMDYLSEATSLIDESSKKYIKNKVADLIEMTKLRLTNRYNSRIEKYENSDSAEYKRRLGKIEKSNKILIKNGWIKVGEKSTPRDSYAVENIMPKLNIYELLPLEEEDSPPTNSSTLELRTFEDFRERLVQNSAKKKNVKGVNKNVKKKRGGKFGNNSNKKKKGKMDVNDILQHGETALENIYSLLEKSGSLVNVSKAELVSEKQRKCVYNDFYKIDKLTKRKMLCAAFKGFVFKSKKDISINDKRSDTKRQSDFMEIMMNNLRSVGENVEVIVRVLKNQKLIKP